MVDCLQIDSTPNNSILNEDGTVKVGCGCLTAVIQRCMLSDHVEYDIQLKHPKGYTWCVARRYREFRNLRKNLQSKYGLPEDQVAAFPGKKFFNNLSPAFVQQRSLELETYLNSLLAYYTLPPPPLVEFIDWERYDVHGITNCLARQLANDGERLLASRSVFVMNVYQLSAVNRRMASPVPQNLYNRTDENFGYVVKFISQIGKLKLFGSLEKIHKSNIAINNLNFDLSPFENLTYLELNNVDLGRMRGFEHIKTTVTHLVVHHSLKNLKNLMLGDLFAAGNGNWVYGDSPVSTLPWDQIKIADFSNNFLHLLDQTIVLLPNVEILNLSFNLLTELPSLTALPRLRVLNLSDNQLYIGEEANSSLAEVCEEEVDLPEGLVLAASAATYDSSTEPRRSLQAPLEPLRERLGDVQILVLANNGLHSASLLEGLLSLQHLDLSNNKIESFEALGCLGELPHLNSLELVGNPICDHPYYRRNALDILGPRFPLIVLDGQRVTAKDCENVHLYRALMKGGVVSEAFPSNCANSEAPAPSSAYLSNEIPNRQDCLNVQIHVCNETEAANSQVSGEHLETSPAQFEDTVKCKTFTASSPKAQVAVDGPNPVQEVSDVSIIGPPSVDDEICVDVQRDASKQPQNLGEELILKSSNYDDVTERAKTSSHQDCNTGMSNASTIEQVSKVQLCVEDEQNYLHAEESVDRQNLVGGTPIEDTQGASEESVSTSLVAHQKSPGRSEHSSLEDKSKATHHEEVCCSNDDLSEKSPSPRHFTSAESKALTVDFYSSVQDYSPTEQSAEELNEGIVSPLSSQNESNCSEHSINNVKIESKSDCSNTFQAPCFTGSPNQHSSGDKELESASGSVNPVIQFGGEEDYDDSSNPTYPSESEMLTKIEANTLTENVSSVLGTYEMLSNTDELADQNSSKQTYEVRESGSLSSEEQSFGEQPDSEFDASHSDFKMGF